MHRKSMLICVLFILTALVSFNGCASETGEASVNTKIFDTKSDNKAASNPQQSPAKRETVRKIGRAHV